MFDTGTYNVLRSAVGASSYRNLPAPKKWNSIDRPHVALVESIGNQVLSFLLSNPKKDTDDLWIKNPDVLQSDAVVEVRYSSTDYRYYRRDSTYWTKVAEKSDPFFIEVYQRGSNPIEVPVLDDNWSALD
ncbi:MAG: hypothetical protein JW779_06425 [Candidatus Thorarchaeota archaeon]|nr:hypothetical protein [Candidatus Thorarchaeota archaeon]